MTDISQLKPKTVYVAYIASTPQKVWQALTEAEFSRQSYDIEQAGDAVKLTMTESHSWEIPDAIMAGGRSGWPAILSNLKSVLETGRPMAIEMSLPEGFMEAVKRAVAEKPWKG